MTTAAPLRIRTSPIGLVGALLIVVILILPL